MYVSGVAVSRNNPQAIVCVTSFRLLRIKSQEISTWYLNVTCNDIFTLHQPIRLQYLDRGNENKLTHNKPQCSGHTVSYAYLALW